MPCSEIADAIVSTGEMIIIRSIEEIKKHYPSCEVIYSDTDSMFVKFANVSLEEARKKGKEITRLVNLLFPSPICLQFEKIYKPCVLEAKKRYVGWQYSTREMDGRAVLDSKGIETVRRDSCLLASSILSNVITKLFMELDVSRVKQYVLRQIEKVRMLGLEPKSKKSLTKRGIGYKQPIRALLFLPLWKSEIGDVRQGQRKK